jgi:hypothetical protein
MPSRYHVIEDARQFVRRCGDGLGGTQFGAHPAIEVPEKRLAAMDRERGHAEHGFKGATNKSRSLGTTVQNWTAFPISQRLPYAKSEDQGGAV